MSGYRDQVLAGMLQAAEAAAPVDAVEAVTRELAAALGAVTVSFLIADLSGRALVRLSQVSDSRSGGRRDGDESALVLPYDGGPAEQALRTQQLQTIRTGEGWAVLAPVTDRGEAIGLLEMVLADEPRPAVLGEISRTAHALAFVVIANRRHTDLFEWGQRTTPFTLSAEIQRRLLPAALTCEASAFTLAGWLEPAASIGGDTFDYSLARDVLHFSVTDAMGHGVASALTATLCVSGLRNSRRRGATLLEQAQAANEAIIDNTPGAATFATGILGRLDLSSGVLDVVNAGHPAPLLVRDGTAQPVALAVNRPFGVLRDKPYRPTQLRLQPGDRLVLLTDGMLERGAAALDLPVRLQHLARLHPREAVRVLGALVLEFAGPTLPDDACLFILDWYGGHGDMRSSTAGADSLRASTSHGQPGPA